ncbi:hypothetical protein MKEN_01022200 [Mycena kentingensis (nom. inval.)]|nr:hypothetical protein MKEN_01022200 [Mycena kentingensis (nom. inval.)]
MSGNRDAALRELGILQAALFESLRADTDTARADADTERQLRIATEEKLREAEERLLAAEAENELGRMRVVEKDAELAGLRAEADSARLEEQRVRGERDEAEKRDGERMRALEGQLHAALAGVESIRAQLQAREEEITRLRTEAEKDRDEQRRGYEEKLRYADEQLGAARMETEAERALLRQRDHEAEDARRSYDDKLRDADEVLRAVREDAEVAAAQVLERDAEIEGLRAEVEAAQLGELRERDRRVEAESEHKTTVTRLSWMLEETKTTNLGLQEELAKHVKVQRYNAVQASRTLFNSTVEKVGSAELKQRMRAARPEPEVHDVPPAKRPRTVFKRPAPVRSQCDGNLLHFNTTSRDAVPLPPSKTNSRLYALGPDVYIEAVRPKKDLPSTFAVISLLPGSPPQPSLDVGRSVISFLPVVDQKDLFVLLTGAPNMPARLEFWTFSTRQLGHENAKYRTIDLPFLPPTLTSDAVSFAILNQRLLLTMLCERRGEVLVFLFDWQDGKLLFTDQIPAAVSMDFLNDEFLLTFKPVSGTLDLWKICEADVTRSLAAELEHTWAFKLPPLAPGYAISDSNVVLRTQAQAAADLIILSIYINNLRRTLLVSRQAIIDFAALPTGAYSNDLEVSWDDWGPGWARWVDPRAAAGFGAAGLSLCGERMVVLGRDGDPTGGANRKGKGRGKPGKAVSGAPVCVLDFAEGSIAAATTALESSPTGGKGGSISIVPPTSMVPLPPPPPPPPVPAALPPPPPPPPLPLPRPSGLPKIILPARPRPTTPTQNGISNGVHTNGNRNNTSPIRRPNSRAVSLSSSPQPTAQAPPRPQFPLPLPRRIPPAAASASASVPVSAASKTPTAMPPVHPHPLPQRQRQRQPSIPISPIRATPASTPASASTPTPTPTATSSPTPMSALIPSGALPFAWAAETPASDVAYVRTVSAEEFGASPAGEWEAVLLTSVGGNEPVIIGVPGKTGNLEVLRFG